LQTATAQEDEPITVLSLLKPCFTPLANRLIDSGLFADLKHSELLVLLTICRFSSGYQKVWCVLGEQKLLDVTGLASSSLYEAKKGLVQRGVLFISYTKMGHCRYQLVDWLQPVRSNDDRAVTPRLQLVNPASPSGGPEPYPSGPPEAYKEKKENIDHHQHRCAAEPLQSAGPVVNDDVLLPSVFKEPELPEAPVVNRSLVRQLHELGVSQFMAYRLGKSQPAEKIEAALARVKTIKLENPAAYVVAELQRGGYGQGPVDKAKTVRQAHEQLHEHRKRERELEELQKEQVHVQTLAALERFQALSPADQAALRAQLDQQAQAEGFLRLANWSEEHPVYRGLLSELVRGRVSEGRPTIDL